MSKLDTELNVTFDNNYGRPCLVIHKNEEIKAMFHTWFLETDVVSPMVNSLRTPLPWGQTQTIMGLVEYLDGTMHLFCPDMIRFVDKKVEQLFSLDDHVKIDIAHFSKENNDEHY